MSPSRRSSDTSLSPVFFGLFWLGQFISTAGDFMFYSLLPFLVMAVETSGVGWKTGTVSFLETLPFLLVAPLAGAVVDRFPRKHVMVLSDLARMGVLLGFWAFWGRDLRFWHIGALAFLHTAFSTFFMPARDALIPQIAGRFLFQANALIQSSTQMAMVAGNVLAGMLLSRGTDLLRMFQVLTVDAVTFLLSALSILILPVRERQKGSSRSVWRETVEGFRYVMHRPFLRVLLVLTALDNFFIMGPATVGASLLVRRTYGLTAAEFAWFEAAMGAGWLVGTLALLLRPVRDLRRGLLWGIVLDGATYLPFLWIRDFSTALFFIFLHGLTIPLITVTRTTLVQKVVPSLYQGRVFALIQLTVLGFMALSSLFTGMLADWVPIPWVFFMPGVLGALTGLIGFRMLPSPTFPESCPSPR